MDMKEVIREQLQSKIHVMQLATTADNLPWVCNVHFDADDDLNIYWMSKTNCRHSEDIEKNPQVAVAILVNEQPPLRGLQIAGKAEQVPFEEHEAVLRHYAERHERETLIEDALSGKVPFKLYRMVPEFIDVIDQKHFPDHFKQTWRP
jgi:uncharacterized protein YhbP (UPF0306 family)